MGVLWVNAAGDTVAMPATIVVLALIVLTPIAIRRHWTERGEFIDHHVRAAARFLTTIGVLAVVVIGLPVLVSLPLEEGTNLWSSLMVLPYLATLVLPLVWAFMAVRAAFLAIQARHDPYPKWAVPFPG